MKNIFLLSLVAFFGLFIACKKDKKNNVAVADESLVKTTSVFDLSWNPLMIRHNYYDTLNRLVSFSDKNFQWPTGYVIYNSSIEYYSNQIVIRQPFSSDTLHYRKYVYTLDSLGRATSSIFKSYFPPNDSSLEQNSTYFYNNKGHLIKKIQQTQGHPQAIYQYNYINGNMVSLSYVSPSSDSITELYFYNTDQFNTIGNQNQGIKFLGISSFNPLTKATRNVYETNFEYQYDDRNRIIQVLLKGVSPGDYNWITMPTPSFHQYVTYTYY